MSQLNVDRLIPSWVSMRRVAFLDADGPGEDAVAEATAELVATVNDPLEAAELAVAFGLRWGTTSFATGRRFTRGFHLLAKTVRRLTGEDLELRLERRARVLRLPPRQRVTAERGDDDVLGYGGRR